jgi:hypothetical protein
MYRFQLMLVFWLFLPRAPILSESPNGGQVPGEDVSEAFAVKRGRLLALDRGPSPFTWSPANCDALHGGMFAEDRRLPVGAHSPRDCRRVSGVLAAVRALGEPEPHRPIRRNF